MSMKSVVATLLMGGSLVAVSSGAEAAVIRIDETSFVAGSGLITFTEPGFPLGTVNPTYTPADYGGEAGAPTVNFGGFFAGQSLGDAGGCPSGAALSGCVVGSPSGPLALDPASPDAFITTDGAFPTSPTLSGTPQFNGPISLLFDVDVAGVGLEGGYFDAIGGTAITAYDRDGNVLGSVLNEGLDIEFLGLITDDGTAQIAGLQFSLVGSEPAGFNIDNVRFGREGEVVIPEPEPVPEPATLLLLGAGLAGLGLTKRRRTA
jgi:hypothetical protein